MKLIPKPEVGDQAVISWGSVTRRITLMDENLDDDFVYDSLMDCWQITIIEAERYSVDILWNGELNLWLERERVVPVGDSYRSV